MSWPLSQDYNEAIQSPATNFTDPDLKKGEAVANALGLPIPFSGNFADVYQVRCPDGSRWAVKCFTREAPGLRERYQEISTWLRKGKLPFTVDFSYLEQGIRVAGKWYPVLKMQWVEGLTLNQFVRQYIDKPAMLEALTQIWGRMAKYLRAAAVAHCDLQHGNILLVPGSGANSLALKLIDYDGMWTPTLAKVQSGEIGHPNYQHPQRLRQGIYNAEVDRFPLLLIATALRALTVKGKALWDKYDNGDNLLFKESDLRDPSKSQLIGELTLLGDPLTAALTANLRKSLAGGLESAPLLEQVLPESSIMSSRPSRLATNAVTKAIPAAAPVVAGLDFGEPAPELVKRKNRRQNSSSASGLVWIGAAAVVLIVVIGGIAAWTMRGAANQPNPEPSVALVIPKEVEVVPPADADPEAPKETNDDAGAPPADADPMKPATEAAGDSAALKPNDAKTGTAPVAVVVAPPPFKKAVVRLAAPDEATQVNALNKIKIDYKEEYAKKKPEDVKALASKLLADGLDTVDDPVSQFVLLRESRDMSAKAGDMPSALRAAEALGERFRVDAAEMRTQALEEASSIATLTGEVQANITALALAYAEDAEDADDYATAERLIKAAQTAVESVANRFLKLAVLGRTSEVRELRTAYASVQDAAKTLATNPDDAAANLALGKFFCLDKGDWDRGLPMLARGSDAKLKDLAVKDAAAPTDAAVQDEVGNGYAELAKGETGPVRKLHLLRRAGYWCKQAEAGLTGLPHTEVVKKIAEIDKTAPAAAPTVLFAAYGENKTWEDHTIRMRVLLAQAKDQKLALKGDAEELVGADVDAFPPKTWVVVYRYGEQVRLVTAAAAEMVKIPAAADAKPGAPAAARPLAILYASCGAGATWRDVTAKAQDLVKDATLTVKPADLGDDFAADPRNSLVLVCCQGGRIRLSITGNSEIAVLPDGANRFDAATRSVSADDLSGGNPTEITNGIRMKLRLIKPGTFLMGSADNEAGRDKIEGPQHEVEISKAFYMGVYPVTVAQFAAFVKEESYLTEAETNGKGGSSLILAANKWEQKPTFTWRHPGAAAGDDYPVVQVSWNDATAFCAWLSKKEGKTYELPTEAEWEYACRAGTKTRYWCGEADVSLRGNANIADLALRKKNPRAAAVPWDDGYVTTSPVGSFKPNRWRLYDMAGNVWQWCADGYGSYPGGYIKDPTGMVGAPTRILRGGSWNAAPRLCRSAWRRAAVPAGVGDDNGFRVVMRIPAKTP